MGHLCCGSEHFQFGNSDSFPGSPSGPVDGVIGVYWADINPGASNADGAGVFYQAFGTDSMVVQWNKDFVQQDLAPAAQTEVAPLDSSDLPGSDDNAAAHDGDVPAAINGEGEALAPAQVTTPDAKGGLVKVETDTLQVTINPVGGDIVSLALPQYPTRKDRPDLPFQLLEQSGNRTYIAQSGLTGQQGPDKSSGRARYSVEQNSYQLADGQEQLVVDLTTSSEGVNVTKRFTFTRGSYLVGVSYLIDNQSSQPWSGSLFGQIKRDGSGDPSSSTATGTVEA